MIQQESYLNVADNRGARKLMGVGQRVIRGAAHVGGVLVVRDSGRVRRALALTVDRVVARFFVRVFVRVADDFTEVVRVLVAFAGDFDIHDAPLLLRVVTPEIEVVDHVVRDPDAVVMAVRKRIMRMPHARQAGIV